MISEPMTIQDLSPRVPLDSPFLSQKQGLRSFWWETAGTLDHPTQLIALLNLRRAFS